MRSPPIILQEHVGLFVRQSRGGGGLQTVLTGVGSDRDEEELLRPETARLVTQLESVLLSLSLSLSLSLHVTCCVDCILGFPSRN